MFLPARALGCVVGSLGILGTNAVVEASVVSLKAVKQNGVAISPSSNLTVVGGDKIETEIFLSGWANEVPLGVQAFRVAIDATGHISGTKSNVLPYGWCAPYAKLDCVLSSNCPAAYPICLADPVGCTCPGHDPARGAFVTNSRPEFLMSGIDARCGVATSALNYLFGCVTLERIGAKDLGVPRYLGTLILTIPPDGCGTFRIGFVDDLQSTYITDLSFPPSSVYLTGASLQPLLLTGPNCCHDCFSCDPPQCNEDARIAHDPSNPSIQRNTYTIVMGFDRPAMGVTPGDFDVTVIPFNEGDIAPSVSVVTPSGNTATILLNRRIAPERWTCVRHIESDRRCCIGSLPGDADDNRISQLSDTFEVYDNLNGDVNPPLAIEKCDIDRSSVCTPADLLMVVDLLNDVGIYCDPFPCMPITLPDCPSVIPPP